MEHMAIFAHILHPCIPRIQSICYLVSVMYRAFNAAINAWLLASSAVLRILWFPALAKEMQHKL